MASESEDVEEKIKKIVNSDCVDATAQCFSPITRGLIHLNTGYSLPFIYGSLVKQSNVRVHCLNVFRFLFGLDRAMELYKIARPRFFHIIYSMPHNMPKDVNFRFINIYEIIKQTDLTEAEQEVVTQFNKTEMTDKSIFEKFVINVWMEFNMLQIESSAIEIRDAKNKLDDCIENFNYYKNKLIKMHPQFNFKPYDTRVKRARKL